MASLDGAAPELADNTTTPSRTAAIHTGNRSTFNIGTRRSQLALWQADYTSDLLGKLHPKLTFSIQAMATMGDKNQMTALHQFNAKSLWTHELEAKLVTGELDLIVHSLKDVPTQLPPDCVLSAAYQRTEKRDSVVMSPRSAANGWTTLADLPAGSVVGTSSVRRIAQLHRLYPDLRVADMRGNINTRLAKLDAEDGGFAALILAAPGVQRIGKGKRVTSFLTRKDHGWYGPVGQGALGIECRRSDLYVREMCETLMTRGEGSESKSQGMQTWYECLAERMLLRTLEGGCSVPIGVDTEWESANMLTLHAVVISVDGKEAVASEKTVKVTSREDAEAFGFDLARELVELGAGEILEKITLNRKIINESGGA